MVLLCVAAIAVPVALFVLDIRLPKPVIVALVLACPLILLLFTLVEHRQQRMPLKHAAPSAGTVGKSRDAGGAQPRQMHVMADPATIRAAMPHPPIRKERNEP